YSHIHYDHFNKADIEEIGNAPRYLVPLGFADNFPTGGFNISELAWYASTQINDLTIHALPAHHFSSRIMVPFIYDDHNKDLWNGWLLEQNGKTLFFAGDTGYSKHFQDIKQKYGEIDVCLMPIASYYHEEDGKWYRYVHTTPEDALNAAEELSCKVMIPWGYGNSSWQMGDHSSHSALLRLLNMQKQMNSQVPVYIMNEGEQISL
ncbi:MAG: MBL fold metallo-hydrolase, partial [Pseudomonadota bacterium]|nr:MBL fold metallo-hydrolase [Pseudomonadota bacterium]